MSQRIAIVGGGSSGWSPKLLSDLMLTPALAGSTFVLHDLNAANAARIQRFADKLKGELGVQATIENEPDPDRALAGAGFVIITVSTGGLAAMAHDLAIPEEYGIYHTVGDTVGPGGWARTMRNVPVFVALAERLNRVAPSAVVLNYTNPMAQLTKVLSLKCQGPVVGLCHGVFESFHAIQQLLGIEDEADLQAVYGGVNHFFWITSLSVRGQDGYALLRQRLDGRSLPEMAPEAHRAQVPWYVADELFQLTGMLTYMADRHTSEFFPQYLTSKENIEKYHIKRTFIDDRLTGMRRQEQNVDAMTAGEIPDAFKHRSRETAADIINAFVTGERFIDVGNTRNVGQIANLPMGAVVETPVMVDGTGFHPVTVGGLPEPARTWVERHTRVQDMVVDAALEGDLTKAMTALCLDPLVSHLNYPRVQEMGMRLLRAHAQLLPQFAGKL
ncbi:MAG: family 4 glycosyl hydrolase [Anaerolineae bacterium]